MADMTEMHRKKGPTDMRLNGFSLLLLLVLTPTIGCAPASGVSSDGKSATLLNVSYDPTRELFQELGDRFSAKQEADTGTKLTIDNSHGGSGSQARKVIDGLEADVVTLALWTDINAIQKAGLIDADWEDRLPNRSLPYYSTIVFVVRNGNPKQVKDWPDLVKGEIQVITPDPKISGNGRLSFLAAWEAWFCGEDLAKTPRRT